MIVKETKHDWAGILTDIFDPELSAILISNKSDCNKEREVEFRALNFDLSMESWINYAFFKEPKAALLI